MRIIRIFSLHTNRVSDIDAFKVERHKILLSGDLLTQISDLVSKMGLYIFSRLWLCMEKKCAIHIMVC